MVIGLVIIVLLLGCFSLFLVLVVTALISNSRDYIIVIGDTESETLEILKSEVGTAVKIIDMSEGDRQAIRPLLIDRIPRKVV